MTAENWDPDEAVILSPPADATDGGTPSCYRYGVTTWEALHHEPLSLALSQEVPDPRVGEDEDEADTDADDWRDVDDDTPFPGRIVADDDLPDDDYGRAVEDVDDFAAEELAMHIVES